MLGGDDVLAEVTAVMCWCVRLFFVPALISLPDVYQLCAGDKTEQGAYKWPEIGWGFVIEYIYDI